MHGLRHVGQPQAATVIRIAVSQWDLVPPVILLSAQLNWATEGIGVQGADGAFRAVYLDIGQAMMPDIETCNNCADCSACKIHEACNMRRGIDGNYCASFWHAGHGALRKSDLHRCSHPIDGTQHGDEGGEIIGPNVEHGASAGLVEKYGSGCQCSMP